MAKWALGWVGLAFVWAISGGCKSGSSDEEAVAPITQDQLPAELAKLICDSLGGCCSSAQLIFDSTNCRANEAADMKAYFGLPVPASVRYDAQAAGDCVAQLKAGMHCGDVQTATNVPACARITVGNLPAGQPCNSSGECAPPGFCGLTAGADGQEIPACVGVDAASLPTHGATGEACTVSCIDPSDCLGRLALPFPADPNQPVQPEVACYRIDGLYCARSPITGAATCQSLGALGADCFGGDGCQDDLFCDPNTTRCTAPHPSGASCQYGGECQSRSCSDTTHTCNNTSVTAQQCANGMP